MFIWIFVALAAHLLTAIVSILDKHFVSKTPLKPVAYAFYSSVFQVLYLVLIPFGIGLPDAWYLALGIMAGILFTLTLIVMYKAMQLGEASRIVPVIGASTPVFTFFLAYAFLGERLSAGQIMAFVFFIAGGLLLSSKISHEKIILVKGLRLAILAGFMFAVYYTSTKFLFLHTAFLSGYLALQIGGFLGSMIKIFSKENRKQVFTASSTIDKKNALLLLPNKIIAALAAVLLFYAISLGSVTLVNSLQAAQYVFLLILAVVFSSKFPHFFKEQVSEKIVVQKILAILLIGVGLFILQK